MDYDAIYSVYMTLWVANDIRYYKECQFPADLEKNCDPGYWGTFVNLYFLINISFIERLLSSFL